MLCLRVAALYQGVTWVIWLLWVSFALRHEMRTAFNLFGFSVFVGKPVNTSLVV